MDSLFSGYIPPIIDDICVSKDEFGGKVKYFMSSDKKSQYFKLNAAQYNFFAEFIPYALKERDSLKLDQKCREISEGKISLNVICQMLQRYNLFDDDKGIKTKVTIDLNSKKFLEIPLEKLNRKRNVWKACFNVVCIISVLIIMMSLAGLILYREHIINELSNMKFSIENVDLKSLIAIAFISALAIVLHESGHLLMAQKLGIEWKSINVSFIWGISPIFYVRYKNFPPVRFRLTSLTAGHFPTTEYIRCIIRRRNVFMKLEISIKFIDENGMEATKPVTVDTSVPDFDDFHDVNDFLLVFDQLEKAGLKLRNESFSTALAQYMETMSKKNCTDSKAPKRLPHT